MGRMRKEYLPEGESEDQPEKPSKSDKKAEKKAETPKDVQEQIRSILNGKDYKGRHYGGGAGDEIGRQDIISTGSFWLDLYLGGGYRSGEWVRFSGDAESGKTSQGLKWAKHWQERYPDDGFVYIFNAEGRIRRHLLERSGISLDPKKFFMHNENTAEAIWDIQEKLILENPSKRRYFFLLDAVDACERIDDRDKTFAESQKVMGGATLLSQAGRRLALLFGMDGHFLYVSNQLRATMNAGYGPQKSASGGNALKFYCSLVGLMKRPYTDTYIYKNPSIKKLEIEEDDRKTCNVLGQFAEIKFEKTPNEKTGQTVSFPVKYGHGIWEAYEAMQICIFWDKYTRESSRSSYQINSEFAQELKDNNITFDEKPRTDVDIRDMFDQNPQLTNYVLQKFRKMMFSA